MKKTVNFAKSAVLPIFLVIGIVQASIDEFMSCDRYFESKRTARTLESIPCDMTKSGFCAYKGNTYPEEAIWRFKEENRALMRRLYGDLESNSVYREMRSANMGHSPSSRLHNLPNEEHSLFSTMSNMGYNIRVGSGLATVQSAKEPVVSPAGAESRLPMKKVIIKKRKKNPNNKNTNSHTGVPVLHQPGVQQQTREESTTPVPSQQGQPGSITTVLAEEELKFTTIVEDVESVTQPGTVEDDTTTLLVTTDSPDSDSDADTTLSSTDYPNKPIDVTSAIPDHAMPIEAENLDESLDKYQSDNMDSTISDLLADVNIDSLEKLVDQFIPSQPERNSLGEEVAYEEEEDLAVSHLPEDQVPYDPNVEQEHLTSEHQPEYDYSGPSMNACPVKEEVFAPYWANNTRDQVLALLNLYPFEQYIHMETCLYPEEQMMCREGCRCEQQYRLHRLLAFDPNNECRGIFSDWFRFPSYCICKCYNFPEGYVPQKRNPKISKQLKLRNHSTRATKNLKMDHEPGEENQKELKNIPAILPYEAKQAILRDIQTKHQSVDTSNNDDNDKHKVTLPEEPEESNTIEIEKRTSDETFEKDDKHFLYGHVPVYEYQLSDGSVTKIPR